MGVRGLTTYIYNNSNKFFKKYELHDCDLVIDGNALVSVLFQNSVCNTSAFGGDYDRFAKAVEDLFNELLKCNIVPYVIFDGGYEKKKISTVINRNKNRMLSLCNFGPTKHSKINFPLMMRQVFRDKLKEMGVSFAQSDFEADSEIAALARKLHCPVMSNDSDFFIYDVSLIPINEFSLEAEMKKDGTFYISCLVYKVEHFLQSLGGLPKSHLPLLATLLGNDYISGSTFSNFYSQMKITRGRKQNQIHHRVKAVISWLEKETFENALNKILRHLKKNKQKRIAHRVAKIIEDYNQVSTPLHEYLVKNQEKVVDIEILHIEDILKQYDCIEETHDECLLPQSTSSDDDYRIVEHGNEISCDEEETSHSDENACEKFTKSLSSSLSKVRLSKFHKLTVNTALPPWLVEHSRKGNVSSCIITLFSLKIYFCTPQVENYDLNNAGEIGLPIISRVAGILLGDNTFLYYHRSPNLKFISSKVQTTVLNGKKKLPHVTTLYNLNWAQRKSLFLDIFEINSDVSDIVNQFPDSWNVFIFSLIFWANNMKELDFRSYHLHSVIIMILCVGVIEDKIGYYRNKRPFMQRYASLIHKKIDPSKRCSLLEYEKLADMIEGIPLQECAIAFDIFLPYFQTEERLKTQAKLFSKSVIHAFAQFQVCIDLAYSLNSFLMTPFTYYPIYKLYNGTFLYNFCCNFKKRSNLSAYIETLLVKCPNLLQLYKTMFGILSRIVPVCEILEKPHKKHKRKQKNKNIPEKDITEASNENDDVTSYSDEENAFSLLSKNTI